MRTLSVYQQRTASEPTMYGGYEGSVLLNALFIPLVYQIHHDLYHYVLFFGAALGNHQGERHKRVVGQARGSVRSIEHPVFVHEPEEKRSRYAFVAVAERMVLGYQIKKHGGFLFDRGVQLFPVEGLINLSDAGVYGLPPAPTGGVRPAGRDEACRSPHSLS